MIMIVRRIGWIILEAALVCLFLHTGDGAVLAFAAVAVIIPIIFLPLNLYARKKLSVEIKSDGTVKKGKTGNISVTMENPTFVPVINARVCVTVENQLNRIKSETCVLSFIMPKSKKEFKLEISDKYCGRVKISIRRLKLYDCFGVLGVNVKSRAVNHITVMPDTFEQQINIIPNPHAADDSDIYAPDRPGSDLSETFQIREYVQGDSPKQIHWKLSGKFDRMIVRDASMPIIRSVLIFWERTGVGGAPELTDAQAEVVVSLCKNLLEQSVQFTVGWNDTDRSLCVLREIHDMDELIGYIPRILRASGISAGVSGAYLLNNELDEIPAHIIYVAETPQSEILELAENADITMLVCGENSNGDAITFDAENYTEKLWQIDI